MFDIEKYSPMEFQYISEGKIKFSSVIAQLFHYEVLGYLKVENASAKKLRSLPEDAKGSDRMYFNGLFYGDDTVDFAAPYKIIAYTINESIRYIEFEQYHRTHKEMRAAYDFMKDELPDADAGLYRYVYADDLEKKYERKHAFPVPEKYEAWRSCLLNIITPDLTPIAKQAFGGIGRAALEMDGFTGGLTASEEMREGIHIDWDDIYKG